MKPADRNVALAHLWLFSAGMDSGAVDTSGEKLVTSLAKVFDRIERDTRREIFGAEPDTGGYNIGELERLLERVANNKD